MDDGISREHAAIESDGNRAVLIDLKSTNGTYCNGIRVTRHELSDGDKVAIGANTTGGQMLMCPIRTGTNSPGSGSVTSRLTALR